MSAAIVQKTNKCTTSSYFECGEIHNLISSTDNKHSVSVHMNVSANLLDNTDSSTNSLEPMEKGEPQNVQESYHFHSTLTRTISQPPPQLQPQQDSNVTTLVNTLIENLGNMNLHRKLERTQSEPLPQQVNTSRYKTELCRPFEEAGECKYGEKCQFAHGYHELRNLQRHPKYKTEYCRTFHSVGFCPYGPRCHFVHNADEARALQQQLQQQQHQQQQSKIQNHSNVNSCISLFAVQTKQQGGNIIANHSLPLSPPSSMSTGSDRESPTGSLSLSPTSSMTNFPYGDQISPANSVFQTGFSYVNTTTTPPESPNAPMSPVSTPPPNNPILGTVHSQPQIYIKPVTLQGKQILQKSSSSPIAIIRNVNKTPTKVNSATSLNVINGTSDDTRLPVFNRLSSAVDKFPNVVL